MKVLAWRYSDGSAWLIERVYEDDERAQKDFELVSNSTDKQYSLYEVELIKKDGTK